MSDAESASSALPTWLRACRHSLSLAPLHAEGRVKSVHGLTLEVVGCRAALGERYRVDTAHGSCIEAEVVGFSGATSILMPVACMRGVRADARVQRLRHAFHVPSGLAMLGRVVDARGMAIDGKAPINTHQTRSLYGAPINPLSRAGIDQPMDVGVRAINGLLTLGRGQRVGLFAGSGVGKSSLLGMMTRHCDAEVIVIGLIGERGREVREFVHDTLGPDALARAVVVSAPADEPPLARLQGAMLATAVAEDFRAAGRQVLLIVDSLTRYAQAQREIGLAAGEPPTSKGYPPSVFASLPSLVERAGGIEGTGSMTAVYTVLAEGDDPNDPVADAARAVLDGHVLLDRELASAGHYPAIDIGASISRVRDRVVDAEQLALARQFQTLHASYREQQDMLRVGLYKPGSDPALDRAVSLWPAFQEFLTQRQDERVTIDQARRALADLLSTNPTSTMNAASVSLDRFVGTALPDATGDASTEGAV